MKTTKPIRERWKRYYELAGRVMLKEQDADRFTVVHGHRYNSKIHRAWIETGDGRIWDPVSNDYTAVDDYMRDAVADHRYSRKDAALAIAHSGHYGPWQ